MSKSKKTNLLGLLETINEFVVPTIQRDYAQGRNKGSDKDLCAEVRTGLIDSILTALTDNEELVLDYIYGTEIAGIFYPIDGQQRLTTLFLMHWYIGKKENRIEETDFNELKKFSYEIRDTSKEFCNSLFLNIDIDFNKSTISEQIRNSAQYHNTYNYDPTVSSMLVVLDLIHEKFKYINELLWDRLRNIQFWCLSLEQFGLTDDLFVKMNARGKRLSRFDVFKSDFESRLEKTVSIKPGLDIAAIEKWKKEIDNSYLDCFWKKYGFELSERNLFRTILYLMKSLISAHNTNVVFEDSWEKDEFKVNYYDILEEVENKPERLSQICNVLSNFKNWEPILTNSGLFIKENEDDYSEATTGYNKVIIFGILYWFSFSEDMKTDENFTQFNRILNNYVYSLRQFNIKPRNYSSSIDNRNVNRCFDFIKKLIDGFPREKSFNDYVRGSNYSELSYEKEKLNHSNLSEIIEIEKLQYIKGNTQNFFFNNNIYLDATQIDTVFADADLTNKAIRIIYSYASDEFGEFKKLLIDEITQQSGKKQLYYNNDDDKATAYFHKIILNRDADFGDNILTAKGSSDSSTYAELSRCVRTFVEDLSKEIKSGKTVQKSIEDLLNKRLNNSSFNDSQNIKWYIVKYPEFFYDKNATSLSVLRRKNYGGIDDDNIYDIQCLDCSDNNFYKNHYHPFYLALSNLLNNKITIDKSELKYTDVHIEYAHPCTLSNGWIIRINKDGNWNIVFKKNRPTTDIPDLVIDASGNGLITCEREDSIARMADFINSL